MTRSAEDDEYAHRMTQLQCPNDELRTLRGHRARQIFSSLFDGGAFSTLLRQSGLRASTDGVLAT